MSRSMRHRQPTAQLSMLHDKPLPATPPALLHRDSNVAALYTGGNHTKSGYNSSSNTSRTSHTSHDSHTSHASRSKSRPFSLSLSLSGQDQEIDPLRNSALQFLPALPTTSTNGHTSTCNTNEYTNTHPGVAGASWDDILPTVHTNNTNNTNNTSEEKKEAELIPQTTTTTKKAHHKFSRRYETAAATSSSSGRRRMTRIQKMAHLWSNKGGSSGTGSATGSGTGSGIGSDTGNSTDFQSLQQQHSQTRKHKKQHQSPQQKPQQQQQQQRQPPASPSTSAGSSSYVGWPGTQIDASGQTVLLPLSSYDDSSAGCVSKLQNQQHQHQQQQQQQLHMSQWTARTSACTTDDSMESFPSPIRKLSSANNTTVFHDDDDDDDGSGVIGRPTNEAEFHAGAAAADALMRAIPLTRKPSSTTPSAISLTHLSSLAKNRGRTFREQPITSSATIVTPKALDFPDLARGGPVDLDEEPTPGSDDRSSFYSSYSSRRGGGRRVIDTVAAGTATITPQPPTEETLQRKDRLTPHRNFCTPTAKGFSGLLDKTKEVPSLMDNYSNFDSDSSSKATSVASGPSPTMSVSARNKLQREFKDYGPTTTTRKRTNCNLGNSADDDDMLSDVFDGLSVSKESDVFDNLSFAETTGRSPRRTPGRHRVSYPERIAEEDDNGETPVPVETGDGIKLVVLGGGLTAVQTTQEDFRKRKTASDFDGNLTNSDVSSSNGYTKIPGFNKMVSAGRSKDSTLRGIHGNIGIRPRVAVSPPRRSGRLYDNASDSGASNSSGRSSLFSDPYRNEKLGINIAGDLSQFYVHQSRMKKVVRKYRTISESVSAGLDFAAYEKEEDDRKAFALVEMRSRIMEKDIERGLERRGGTVVVDDLITTPYNLTAQRVRDAVIVSKAWRDGATVSDVVKTALLTRRAERCYFVKRYIPTMSSQRRRSSRETQRFTWEPVQWMDDTDLALYRCPSLGARHMRGVEMFTIGDCQSMLLKLTNERCMELRKELNEATKVQIVAEEHLREEGDNVEGAMMTRTEIAYLEAMERVKSISKRLVSSEQAFALVRERVQKLITRYESLLSKIETESFAGASSVITHESSYFSEFETSDYWEREERMWARRARRAEIRAEIAAREALLAQNKTRIVQQEKMVEVDALKQKLAELQSESSAASAENERLLVAKSMGARFLRGSQESPTALKSANRSSNMKLDGVKKRFRDRMAAKKQTAAASSGASRYPSCPTPSSRAKAERVLISSAGEEMCQQMDFYERSLKAVDSYRDI